MDIVNKKFYAHLLQFFVMWLCIEYSLTTTCEGFRNAYDFCKKFPANLTVLNAVCVKGQEIVRGGQRIKIRLQLPLKLGTKDSTKYFLYKGQDKINFPLKVFSKFTWEWMITIPKEENDAFDALYSVKAEGDVEELACTKVHVAFPPSKPLHFSCVYILGKHINCSFVAATNTSQHLMFKRTTWSLVYDEPRKDPLQCNVNLQAAHSAWCILKKPRQLNQRYRVSIKAENPLGSSKSDVLNFTALERARLPKPDMVLRNSSAGAQSALLTAASSIPRREKLTYKVIIQSQQCDYPIEVINSSNTLRIPLLWPGYHYSVRGTVKWSDSQVWSLPRTLHTSNASVTPPAPRGVQLLAHARRALRLTWSVPNCTTGPVDAYRARLVCQRNRTEIIKTTTEGHSLEFDGLGPYELCSAVVQAHNKAGGGAWSESVKGRTFEEDLRYPPLGVQVLSMTARSAQVTWLPGAVQYDNVTFYKLRLSVAGQETIVKAERTLRMNLTSLQPYTTYNMHVQECSINSCSPLSENITFTTNASAPGLVTGLDHSVEAEQIRLTWERPSEWNGEPHGFLLTYPVPGAGINTSNFSASVNSTKLKKGCKKQESEFKVVIRAVSRNSAREILEGKSKTLSIPCTAEKTTPLTRILIIVAAVIVLGALVFFLILRYRRKKWKSISEPDVSPPPLPEQTSFLEQPSDGVELQSVSRRFYLEANDKENPIENGCSCNYPLLSKEVAGSLPTDCHKDDSAERQDAVVDKRSNKVCPDYLASTESLRSTAKTGSVSEAQGLLLDEVPQQNSREVTVDSEYKFLSTTSSVS